MSDAKIATRTRAQLEYPFPEVPATGDVSLVAPGVYWVRMPLPLALDHINLWLLADGDGWTIVDTGYATDTARNAWTSLLDGGSVARHVSRLLITHCHPDHIGLAAWLCRTRGLLPWMTQAEYLLAQAAHHRVGGTDLAGLLALSERHGLDAARLAAIRAREDHFRQGVDGLPVAYRRIRGGDTIRIGEHRWHVVIGRGHSPEHAALHCAELDVIIAGDMLLPRISTNVGVWPMEPDADPLGEFLASIAEMNALPGHTLILPSHGLPFRGLHARIAELQAHHDERLARVAAACAEPRCAAEALPFVFTRKFDDNHLFLAMGETIAHLNYLMHRNRLARTQDANGVYRFQAS